MDLRQKKRIMGGGGGPEEEETWPSWLHPLLNTSFFVQCKVHAASRKSKCNMYCLDCTDGALCSLCLSSHQYHRAIQIRRSSYHDVIRVNEIQKVLDISGVQTYVINSAKVVFLNKRPKPRQGKGVINTCEVCERSLLDSFRFCSLGCKITGTTRYGRKRSGEESASDSDSSQGKRRKTTIPSFTPSPPPPTSTIFGTTKRRKGVPHRAPLTGLILQF